MAMALFVVYPRKANRSPQGLFFNGFAERSKERVMEDDPRRSHLVQILLPLFDDRHRALSRDLFQTVAAELTEQFGGLTAYTRAPAEGSWQSAANASVTWDEIVVYEVMVARLDSDWWTPYRKLLEHRFRQAHVIVRAFPIRLL
jgi:hypothetical protein